MIIANLMFANTLIINLNNEFEFKKKRGRTHEILPQDQATPTILRTNPQ